MTRQERQQTFTFNLPDIRSWYSHVRVSTHGVSKRVVALVKPDTIDCFVFHESRLDSLFILLTLCTFLDGWRSFFFIIISLLLYFFCLYSFDMLTQLLFLFFFYSSFKNLYYRGALSWVPFLPLLSRTHTRPRAEPPDSLREPQWDWQMATSGPTRLFALTTGLGAKRFYQLYCFTTRRQ